MYEKEIRKKVLSKVKIEQIGIEFFLSQSISNGHLFDDENGSRHTKFAISKNNITKRVTAVHCIWLLTL